LATEKLRFQDKLLFQCVTRTAAAKASRGFYLCCLVQSHAMRHRKPTHPVTADMRRELSVAALAKAGAFKRQMRFPFQHLETDRFLFAQGATQGAFSFITTAYFSTVGRALICGFGRNKYVAGRG
jgi:hypothetical protein